MAKISLASYTIRIIDKSTQTNVELSNFSNGVDILSVLNNYLISLQNSISIDPIEKKLLRVTKLNSSGRRISGIIETGLYGFEADLLDRNTKALIHKRKVDEAEMYPFYFSLEIPEKVDEGLLILQRFQQYGIRKIFVQDFMKYFSKNYRENTFKINPLMPEEEVKEYLTKGRIKKIRFIRFDVPDDITNYYDTGHEEEGGYMEVVVSANRNRGIPFLNRIKKFLDGDVGVRSLIELPDVDYDIVKVEVELNKNHRTIDLTNLNKIRAYYDITDEVKTSSSGHPRFDSIDQISSRLLVDISQSLKQRKSN